MTHAPANPFEYAVDLVVDLEGLDKVTRDPDDPGGTTKFGIAQKFHPDVDVENLTRDQAVAIYRKEYWDKCHCDDMSWPLALFVFDSAVNQSPDDAIHMMQDALDLTMDGVIGPKTTAAMKRAAAWYADRFMAIRAIRYTCSRNFSKYGEGWLTRVFTVARHWGGM